MRRLLLVALALLIPAAPAHGADAKLRIEVLSNRADLVSGGDALVRITRPAGAASAPLRVRAGRRDVSSVFGRDGVGLVEGLPVGRTVLSAKLPDGRGARLTITNHPSGGPIFSGPQVQPWICNNEDPPGDSPAGPRATPTPPLGPPKDAQCTTDPVVSHVYKSTSSGGFEPYDPAAPPDASAIATTTTDEGRTVPYVVRQEFGVQNRGIYAIAVLAEPGAWNGKLLTSFGAGTSVSHQQTAPSAVLDDKALSRGFMAANSGLNVNGDNVNQVVSAEALLMLKEHITERYGPIRYTIGEGCSGGSYQVMIAALYPGLVDGAQPNCSFTDIWTTASEVFDCGLLINYFQRNPQQPWLPSIDGHRDPSDCAAWQATFFGAGDPAKEGNCDLPDEQTYDPEARPEAERCAIPDYQRAIWGLRPPSLWGPVEQRIGRGFANRPWGNAGVQYGLRALEAGELTPAQFVELNTEIGGLDIDHGFQPERSEVDANTAAIAYRAGQVTDARQLATVPIVDLRAYSESAEVHTSFHSYKMRARLDQALGHHDNHLIWTFPASEPILGMVPPPDVALESFLLVDEWLERIEADTSTAPLAEKVRRSKPDRAVDKCFTAPASALPGAPSAPGAEITDPAQCAALYPPYGVPRTAAGGPRTDHLIQCARKPVRREDYGGVAFTDAQLDALRKAFPGGVCDYSKPGVGEQPAVPWMSFAAGPGGKPLGPVPRSRALPCRRSVRLRIRGLRGAQVRSVVVYVAGRRVRKVDGPLRRVTVALRGQGRKRVVLVVRAIRGDRRVTIRDRRSYRVCAARRAR